ncbi:M20 metallopeptidase family protein [Paenibacillus cymbidii]|uniref:M20 metallopeptidase family protein n=1 Tax=Paenibacillus cymbidii TaxID=1639034 RepID=UPI001080DF00|nr:amidohydrolase [Paenibacillus cymbidii]
MLQELREKSKQYEQRLTAFRRDLHEHPELSLQESRTAAKVLEQLEPLALDIRTGVGGHGIVADLRTGRPGPTIALRADMDALPIREESGVPFASRNAGVMHACGHDAHTAMLLGAAWLLDGVRDRLSGTVRLLFQSAEEINAGAKAMIAEGALDGVKEIYGLHNMPNLPAGLIGTRSGPMMGSVDRIDIVIVGKGGHGAIPDQCIDPIVASSAIVMGLQTAVSREISPFEPAVVTIGSFRAGDANNVIPSEAVLSGTIRTFSPAVQQRMPGIVERIVTEIAGAYRCQAKLVYTEQNPVLVNDAASVGYVDRAIDDMFGRERRVEGAVTAAGEDFSAYLQRIPGAFVWLGSGPQVNAEAAYGLHHPKYVLDESCLPQGAALLAGIAAERCRA